MSNAVYQATVEQLEAVLSPRVVSRSLQEGLRQLGRSPETVDYASVEQILKAQIYRQLQVTMPVTLAKKTIQEILDRVQGSADGTPEADEGAASAGLERQATRLDALKAAMRPFNLYFEWPEVQKLRAQVQLLESEQEAGREATSLVDDAEAQLQEVEQKLEDHLVLQARELGELQEAFEQVRTLGGAKVRRLESLVHHIGEAQAGRQLAPAEVERARRLARDLRKLMESSVYSEEMGAAPDGAADAVPGTEAASLPGAGEDAGEGEPADAQAHGETPVPTSLEPSLAEVVPSAEGAPSAAEAPAQEGGGLAADAGLLDVEGEEEDLLTIDTASLDPEVGARLLLLDLEGERHDLEALAQEHSTVLGYRPTLQQEFERLRGRLAEDDSVAEELDALRHTLTEAFESQRTTLREELGAVEASLDGIRGDVDVSELRQGLRVALGILSTTLPTLSDIEHLRHLQHLALERAEEFDRAEEEATAQHEARLREQAAMLDRLETTLLRYEGQSAAEEEYRRLQGEVEALREAHTQEAIAPELLDNVRRAEASLESAMAVLADERVDRQRARLRTLLTQVQALPTLGTVAARISSVVGELERQLAQLDHGTLDEAQLEATASVVTALKADARVSLQRKLEALASEAGEVGSPALLERIRRSMDELDDERYPDLHQLRAALKQEREAQRSEQVGELHLLEREATRYAGVDSPTYARLQARLTEARERIGQGALAPGLVQARTLLEQVGSEVDNRLSDLLPRLDEALERFHTVEKLNSDDVATVRRILTHLDSQRDALERVSVGLRLQLEASLAQAEGLLGKLREEYDATRAIADQLVSANVLDDVFGLLGDAAGDETGEAGEAPDADTLLRPYLEEEEVLGAAVLDADGRILAGSLPWGAEALARLRAAVAPLADAAAAVGGEEPRLATLEHRTGALLLGWPGERALVVLALRSRSDLSLLANRLGRDLSELERAVSARQSEPGEGPHDAGGPALA